jgi:hypothetical protein
MLSSYIFISVHPLMCWLAKYIGKNINIYETNKYSIKIYLVKNIMIHIFFIYNQPNSIYFKLLLCYNYIFWMEGVQLVYAL